MASNPASSQKLGRPGIVFICGKSTKGKVALSSELLGQDIIHLAGNGRDLFVCTSNGLFSPSEKTLVSSFEGVLASQYASGGQHAICLTPMGELYAWGNGPLGELGLGTVTKSTPQTPQKIHYNATFVSISCGADHSVAMDGCGNAFAWGQNRHRQLGLYNTLTSSSSSSSSNLTASFASSSSTKFKPETNFLIEDFLFVPRFLPFSLKNPVLKVACGSKFTLAVTKSGDIFSWGAGECGQLGNNGCSFKEVPSKIDMEEKSTIVDIAAGYAHCLALSSEGVLYSWGLNAKQELGLGESHRRVKMCSAPMKVNVESSSLIVKVAANVHSSACINQEGELFTWGSSSHGKLMHGEYDGRDIATPQLVEALRQSKVKEVLITSEEAAVFVPSSFDSLSPKSGPMKSFTRLTLFGCGFYPSENCIVRFKLQPSTRFSASKLLPHPSRSCQGTVVDQNNIICIPPKLSTAGDYEVTLSLNGIDFLDNSFIASVYPEPVVFSVEPKLIDASQASTFDIELMLKKVSSLEVEDISVRFTAFSLKTSASATSAINGIGEVTLLARRGDLGLATASDNEPSSEGLTKLKCLLDLSVFPSTPEGLLLKVAVSLNHQDFSKPCVDPILCLSCEPQSIFPTSYSTLTTPELPTEICISGSGFPPSSAVSTLIRISLTPHAMDAIVLHARSELASELYFTAPTYQDIVSKLRYQENDDMGSFQVFIDIVVNGILVNASHPFALTLYTPLPLILSTYLVRKKGGTTLTIDSDCFTFQAEDARLRFSIPSLDIAQDKQVALALQEAAPALLLSTEDGLDGSEISKKYQIKMDLPPLSELFSASESSISEALSSSETSVSMNPEQMVGALATGTTMTVSLLLNGITLPPVEHVVVLTIFDGLKAFVCKSTVKGGMAALSTAIISCQGLLASENCIVRLIGGKGNSLDVVNAIVNEEESTVSFVIPEEVSSLLAAETKAKVKYYFVAISIDGGLTFDRSETAILGLK